MEIHEGLRRGRGVVSLLQFANQFYCCFTAGGQETKGRRGKGAWDLLQKRHKVRICSQPPTYIGYQRANGALCLCIGGQRQLQGREAVLQGVQETLQRRKSDERRRLQRQGHPNRTAANRQKQQQIDRRCPRQTQRAKSNHTSTQRRSAAV